ncbi:MAG: formate dehydrogenase subunit gamma [Inquilinus sp.]|nr:formate dehydrogenase subunit gamma [Inquilinus sp.]
MRHSHNGRSRRGFSGLIPAIVLFLALYAGFSVVAGSWAQEALRPAQETASPTGGMVPGESLGSASDAEIWRAVRQGAQGNVSIPNAMAGVLIQSEGENWRNIRNGPLSVYGIWGLLGMVIALALFFAVRGRIRIDSGRSDKLMERFNDLERFAHWLMAGSFIVLALSGLNMLYGRYALLPLLGENLFATLTQAGKVAHHYIAFAFMAGLVLSFVLWVRHNFPDKTDLAWLAKAGGLFTRKSHPPAKKFNTGQKLLFWLVMLSGLAMSLSGIALLFPFQFGYFEPTFRVLAAIGFDVPTQISPMAEMQLSQIWHAIVGLVMVMVILGHIYIGTIGMEGAFDAMGSGQVDRNWAREHHSLWVEEVERGEPKGKGRAKAAAGGDD